MGSAQDWLNAVDEMPPSKYSAKDVLDAIDASGPGAEDFWDCFNYKTKQQDLVINGTTETVTKIEEYGGGEGDGEERWLVFKIGDQMFRKDGYYASYDGTTWDGDVYECFPVVRPVTFYERSPKVN